MCVCVCIYICLYMCVCVCVEDIVVVQLPLDHQDCTGLRMHVIIASTKEFIFFGSVC